MHYNAVFISDTHLGSKKCKAKSLAHFLEENTFDELYLVGDIVDIWRFKQAFKLSNKKQKWHVRCFEMLLDHANRGTKIHYVYGNHDEFMSRFVNVAGFGNIQLSETADYTDSKGNHWHILHGHQYDLITKYAAGQWIGKLGDHAYDTMIAINECYNSLRRLLGLRYWSLSRYLKVKVKKAQNFVSRFEEASVDHAQKQGYHGVIAGHIHDPCVTEHYANCGCWTDQENCTFLYDNGKGLKLGHFQRENA